MAPEHAHVNPQLPFWCPETAAPEAEARPWGRNVSTKSGDALAAMPTKKRAIKKRGAGRETRKRERSAEPY
jgi:hypothetical protein